MNKRLLITLAAVLAIGFTANAARAQCGFNHPKKTVTFKSNFVQAFVSCGNPGGNTPNSTTEGGVPSCAPPETFNQQAGSPPNGWFFDPERGQGRITIKPTREPYRLPPTPLNPPGETGDLHIQFALANVLDAAGRANGPGTLATVARATLRDRQPPTGPAGDVPMTVIDFPAPFPFSLVNGSVHIDTSADALLNGIGQPGLPHCSSIELVSITVADENGNTFANLGAWLEP